CGNAIRSQAEILIGTLGRSRDAEPVDADAQAVEAGVALPAEGGSRLDRDTQYLAVADVGQDVFAIGLRLRVETLGARHRDDVGADPPRFKLLGGSERNFDFGTGRDQDRLARLAGGLQPVGTPRT